MVIQRTSKNIQAEHAKPQRAQIYQKYRNPEEEMHFQYVVSLSELPCFPTPDQHICHRLHRLLATDLKNKQTNKETSHL